MTPANSRDRRGAFTLLELLIVITMIAVLLGIVLPVMGRTLEAGRAFKCRMAMRSVTMDFLAFGDANLHADRGKDQELANDRFYLETFQESQYGIDEFWAWGDDQTHSMPDAAGNNPMRCPSVDGDLVLKKNLACSNTGALTPAANVSFTFNSRLHRPEVVNDLGQIKAEKVKLNPSILDKGGVPLLWDVDGAKAAQNGVSPAFSAPALDSEAVYADNAYWFPGMRHNGTLNIAFIGGHVISSTQPLEEAGAEWNFQPVD